MESYQDVKREGTVTLFRWLAGWLANLTHSHRKHASHVLQVARCRSQSQKPTSDFAGERVRDAEDSTGNCLGQMAR